MPNHFFHQQTARTAWFPAAVVIAAGTLFAGPKPASAAPITFYLSANGSGTLGGTSFTNADFTITAQADTTAVNSTNPSILLLQSTTTTINITGLSTATLVTPLRLFDNQNNGVAGISRPTDGSDVFTISSSAFSTYNLDTDIGPITGSSRYGGGVAVTTDRGNLALTLATGPGAYRAVVGAAAPEPGTLSLAGMGLGMAGGTIGTVWRRKAKKQTA